MYGEILDFQCQHTQRWQRRVILANLLQKLIFCDREFYVTIAEADIDSLKSLNTLFDKYSTTCW